MTIEEMKARKRELGLSNDMIAEASGLPLSTIQKIFGGVTKSPRKATIDALEEVLKKKHYDFTYELPKDHNNRMGEALAAYRTAPEPERYTIEDYYALPDERRVELIDGKFYDMAAPSSIHQTILGELHLLFRECIGTHGMPCRVLFAPFDVHLDRDLYTMVQPDLLVLCSYLSNLTNQRLEGPPDLAVEILSPSTRSKDMILKLYKYKNAGVREYWIVDPKNHTVTVHNFEEAEYTPRNYTFDDRIPVGISETDCEIDFTRVRDAIVMFEQD